MDSAAILDRLDAPLLVLAGLPVSSLTVLVVVGAICLLLLLWRSLRNAGRRRDAEVREVEAEGRMQALLAAQAEMTGRMQTLAEVFGARQAELTRALGERLDGMSSAVGRSILDTTKETRQSLSALGERLAVIDRAQGRISDLAGEVVRLQDILSNKQTRGAFGQGRMEAIVMDGLPPGAYSFQATLSNGKRPDCLVHMPNGAPSLAIDAKFPLEAWQAFREAEDDAHRLFSAQRLRRDMDVHVKAIAEKYLLPGETQDTAFLFVPSESIFAELHENFPDAIQKAHRSRVVVVSPSLLMLSIQVVQALLRDTRMREEAGLIQKEVRLLMEDVVRLDARVAALKTHFGHAGRDIDQILVSTEKLMRRGERIEGVDLGDVPVAADGPALRKAVPGRDRGPVPAARSDREAGVAGE